MSVALGQSSRVRTLTDLLEELGGIAPERVLAHPPPGGATEADLVDLSRHDHRLYELVNGVLVEKALGYRESLLACTLISILRAFVRRERIGLVTGADGTVRLFPGVVRIPDVAFTAWSRIPGGRVPSAAVPALVPDLAIEIVSEGNTEREMDRKRDEYLKAGVREVWLVDPRDRTVRVCRPNEPIAALRGADRLLGGAILPGFSLPLPELFADLDPVAPESV